VQEALALKDFDLQTWFALAGPNGLPRPIVERLNAELRKALATPEVSKGLETIGELNPTTPEVMRDRVAGELKTWIKVVDDAQIPKQ
jgi:tripartite-type tricarboxylate transporter receptor subunit TctC